MPSSILIVDDSPCIRRLLRHFIEQNNEWELCGEAENGQIAIDKVQQFHPNLVILDLQMPVMNGLEAARRITQASPDTTVVLFTMHESAHVLEEAEKAGIKFVFSKSDVGPQGLFSWLGTVA